MHKSHEVASSRSKSSLRKPFCHSLKLNGPASICAIVALSLVSIYLYFPISATRKQFNATTYIKCDESKPHNTSTHFRHLSTMYYKAHVGEFAREGGSAKFKRAFVEYLSSQPNIRTFGLIDIGANKGQIFHTDWLRRKDNYDRASFLLIEPNTNLVSKVLKPLQEKKLKELNDKCFQCRNEIEVKNLGMGNSEGQLWFAAHKDKDEISHLMVSKPEKPDLAYEYNSVSVCTLDGLLLGKATQKDCACDAICRNILSSDVRVLKTDTEGWDLIVHRGGAESVPLFDVVIWECHVVQKKEYDGPGTTVLDSAKFFNGLGFSLYKLGTKVHLPLDVENYDEIHDNKEFMGWQNCAAVNRKSKIGKEIEAKMHV